MAEEELKPVTDAQQMRDQVYQRLRRAIFQGRLKPGERLVERKLAEQLGVSRTPVREAIRMLELEGLVYHQPRIGAVVAEIDDSEVLEIYRIRAVLEGLAARMAAERIEPEGLKELELLYEKMQKTLVEDPANVDKVHREFNDLIYRAAGSPRLYNMVTTLADYVIRYANIGYSNPERLRQANNEHRQLLEAIKLRDGDLAERVAREHIENSKRAYFREIKKLVSVTDDELGRNEDNGQSSGTTK